MFPVRETKFGDIMYVARSRATVIDNKDPQKKGRIRVNTPLVGDSVWISYLMTGGLFDPPKVGDIVFVEAEEGYPTHLIAWGKIVKGSNDNLDINPIFQRPIPTNRGYSSPLGQTIEIDDGQPDPSQVNPGDTNTLTTNRGIRLTTKSGNKIQLIEDTSGGNEFILIEDSSNSNSIKINTINNTITSTNSNNKIFKLADKQILGQGIEPMVLGETLFNMLNTFLNSVITGIQPGTPGQNAASLLAIKQAATTLQTTLPSFKSPNSTLD